MVARDLLASAGIEPGEAELLLAGSLRVAKESLLAHPETRVPPTLAARFRAMVARRRRHEPIAYLLGEKWFYGRPFLVTKDVLIPRPETETMVEVILSRAPKEAVVFDIGAGSGAISLSLVAGLPRARAVLADVSPKALAVARKNARRLGLNDRVSFRKLDILERSPRPDLPDGFLVVAANLPYLPTAVYRKTMPDVRRFEPKLALVSGQDGLDHYRALMSRLSEWTVTPDLLLLEADPPQFSALKKIVRGALPRHRLRIQKDLAGNARILLASK